MISVNKAPRDCRAAVAIRPDIPATTNRDTMGGSMGNTDKGGSTTTLFLGAAYLGLMLFCLWAAGETERANYASTCLRLGTTCTTPAVRA